MSSSEVETAPPRQKASSSSISSRLLRAVVLDWAGTTQDYGSLAPVGAFVEVFKRFGVGISLAAARGPMGIAKLDHLRAIAASPEVSEEWQRVHGSACGESEIQAMYEALVPIQEQVIPRFSKLIPGTLETASEIRSRGYAIGATTGYPRSVAMLAAYEAIRQGYEPDSMVCADDVPAARPEPWMLLRVMEALRAFPPHAVVKVGDTLADIDEGFNAGTWTVGVASTGNYVGLTQDEMAALPASDRRARIEEASALLRTHHPHYVIDSVAALPPILDDIEIRLSLGERP